MTISITTVIRDASSFGGGIANVALSLHKALLETGLSSSLVSGNEPAERMRRTWIASANHNPFSSLPAEAIGAIAHIHGIWTPFEFWVFREAKRRGVKTVVSPHGALEAWAFHHKRTKKRIAWWLYQKRVLQHVDLLVANSQQEHDRLRMLGLKQPIANIPNGVNVEGFNANAATRREPIVLFFSRLDAKKGLFDLIEAWGRLSDRNSHVLHIQGYGDPSYIARVANKIRELGLEEQILMLPPVFGAERWAAFQKSSIYVLPTYSENFGITVAEALMAGLPVITTTSTPWREVATRGLGWIIDNDIRQLTDALQAATKLNNSELRDMRVNAYIYSSRKFRWEVIAEMYKETYAWVLEPARQLPAWVTTV